MAEKELYLGPRGPFPKPGEVTNKVNPPTTDYNVERQLEGFDAATQRREVPPTRVQGTKQGSSQTS